MLWAAVLLLQAAPLQMVTRFLPLPQPGKVYEVQLRAKGGTPPYTWSAKLPGGLQLDANTGRLYGRVPEHFSMQVHVSDSSTPPVEITRLLTASAGPPLEMDWRPPPVLSGDRLSGGVRVGNGTGQSITLTVIAVAVNEIGKAFALRYDHEDLQPEAATPDLQFSVTLPPGRYTVHVDAVAEITQRNQIYRDRLEQPGLVIP